MAIKEIFEGHTDRINHATELLKVLGDREGQYVWKKIKTELQEIIVTNPSFSMEGDGNQGWRITSATFDHTQVTLDFFDGFQNSVGSVVFKKNENGKVQLKAMSYQGSSLTYNPATGFFQNNMPSATGELTGISYSGTKTYTGTVEIVDYVVADDAEAYPNGGELDGYWYELMSTSSGIDFGKVTLTATATNITVQHNLKVAPSQAILIELGDFTNSTARTRFAIDNGKSELVQSTNGGNPSNTTNIIALTSTEISFDSYSSIYKYVAGAYLWIAVA